MRIVVSDTSCMIDLKKAALLDALLRLPYTFVMPDALFNDEWLTMDAADKERLCRSGLQVQSLPGASVLRAQAHFNRHRRLKLNDCFALALAEGTQDCILLTGDAQLRRVAESQDVEVRGVLWVTDELETQRILPLRELCDALQRLHQDQFVFLPEREVQARIERLSGLI